MVGPQHDMPNQTSHFRLYTHSGPICLNENTQNFVENSKVAEKNKKGF